MIYPDTVSSLVIYPDTVRYQAIHDISVTQHQADTMLSYARYNDNSGGKLSTCHESVTHHNQILRHETMLMCAEKLAAPARSFILLYFHIVIQSLWPSCNH